VIHYHAIDYINLDQMGRSFKDLEIYYNWWRIPQVNNDDWTPDKNDQWLHSFFKALQRKRTSSSPISLNDKSNTL